MILFMPNFHIISRRNSKDKYNVASNMLPHGLSVDFSVEMYSFVQVMEVLKNDFLFFQNQLPTLGGGAIGWPNR